MPSTRSATRSRSALNKMSVRALRGLASQAKKKYNGPFARLRKPDLVNYVFRTGKSKLPKTNNRVRKEKAVGPGRGRRKATTRNYRVQPRRSTRRRRRPR